MTRFVRICLAILVAAAMVRLVMMGVLPLADTTEARYGEIARLMVASGDWVTPHVQHDVPFWGKPPLSIWFTAASMSVFGVTEFWARLPAFLLVVASAWLVVDICRPDRQWAVGIMAAVILLTTWLGFISAGAIMTDPALLLTTTLAMVAFWRAVVGRITHWGYIFFAALGLGLLAKGPVALVLVLIPVFVWTAWQRSWHAVLRELPWGPGVLLGLLIAIPWYLAAENKTPGFLHYFLVGEHWLRFVDSGWAGDLYGSAHAQPRGMIWMYWLGAAFPWSIVALALAGQWLLRRRQQSLDAWQAYLLAWLLTPMLFFTLAGNILPAYVLPGLPALALLIAEPLAVRRSRMLNLGWFMPLLFIVAGPILIDELHDRSHKEFVASMPDPDRLVYVYSRPISAMFYSAGQARYAATLTEAQRLLDRPGVDYLVIRHERSDELPERMAQRLVLVRKNLKYELLAERLRN